MADETQNQSTVYRQQGGDILAVDSGGEIEVSGEVEVQSGGEVEVLSGGILDIQSGANVLTTIGIGAKNGATVAAVEAGMGILHRTTLTCTATPITMSDESGVGQWGGTKLYDFPAGVIVTFGGVIDGSVTTPVHDHSSGGTIATWDGYIALGTEYPSDHATGLAAADSGRYLQSTAVTTAEAQVANVDAISAATGLTESGARWTDGTTTNPDLFLNLLIDDSENNDACEALFTGTVTFAWLNLGDK